MFFLLAGAVRGFVFLKYGLGVILVFVGLKMVWLNEAFDGKFPITWSLAIIGAILAISILVSIGYSRTRLRREQASQMLHAGISGLDKDNAVVQK
jgi:predicted tellurium resistance membrane protein TerC